MDSPGDDVDATLITYGPIATQAQAAIRKLAEKDIHIRLLTLHSVTHFSEDQIADLVRGDHTFVVEEICAGSGISETIAMILQKRNVFCKVHGLDLGNHFVPHGSTNSLYNKTGLDCASIADYMSEVLLHED